MFPLLVLEEGTEAVKTFSRNIDTLESIAKFRKYAEWRRVA